MAHRTGRDFINQTEQGQSRDLSLQDSRKIYLDLIYTLPDLSPIPSSVCSPTTQFPVHNHILGLMSRTKKTVVVVNSSGRQGASFARSADAVGWRVRAHMKDRVGIVAEDISSLTNVTVVEGSLTDPKIIAELFEGSPDLAFINTVHWGDEVAIGKALADAAKKAGVKHIIFSSMPDHSSFGKGWKPLPMWETKVKIEAYIRQLRLPATFVYTGIYHNNFTSLNYPLFQMELQEDDSFEWQAPFDPDKRLPWLDAEHDVGPAVLQIFMDGPGKWAGKR